MVRTGAAIPIAQRYSRPEKAELLIGLTIKTDDDQVGIWDIDEELVNLTATISGPRPMEATPVSSGLCATSYLSPLSANLRLQRAFPPTLSWSWWRGVDIA